MGQLRQSTRGAWRSVVKLVAILLLVWFLYMGKLLLAAGVVPLFFVDYLVKKRWGKKSSADKYDMSRGMAKGNDEPSWLMPLLLLIEAAFFVYAMCTVNVTTSSSRLNAVFGDSSSTPVLSVGELQAELGQRGENGAATSGAAAGVVSSIDPRNRDRAVLTHLKTVGGGDKDISNGNGNGNQYDSYHRLSIDNVMETSVPVTSRSLIAGVLGPGLTLSGHPDLRRRTVAEVRQDLQGVFAELPASGFSSSYKNPCWDGGSGDGDKERDSSNSRRLSQGSEGGGRRRRHKHGSITGVHQQQQQQQQQQGGHGGGSSKGGLRCLPFVYLLGQPKCGTSDLFERLGEHPLIAAPEKKEIRWFTRGEFTWNALPKEGGEEEEKEGVESEKQRKRPLSQEQVRLGPGTTLGSFTQRFAGPVSARIQASPLDTITIDGGPHTLWWGVQNSDGHYEDGDTPPAQILRQMQPNARFIVTAADPVKRMYSDYYFLDDNLKPVSSNDRLIERYEAAKEREAQHATSAAQQDKDITEKVHSLETKLRALAEQQPDSVDEAEKERLNWELRQATDARREQESEGRALRREVESVTRDQDQALSDEKARGLPHRTEKSAEQFHSRAKVQVGVMTQCVAQRMATDRAYYTGSGRISTAAWDAFMPETDNFPEPSSEIVDTAEAWAAIGKGSAKGSSIKVRGLAEWWQSMTHLAAGGSSGGGDEYSLLIGSISPQAYWKARTGIAARDTILTSSGSKASDEVLLQAFFRASQECAHDRHRLARGGWGRLSIGLYALFYEKWLEYFPPSAFHWARLEHYDGHERAHLAAIFSFLGVGSGNTEGGRGGEGEGEGENADRFWGPILHGRTANVNHHSREPMMQQTEQLLRSFYLPYNLLLARLLRTDRGEKASANKSKGNRGRDSKEEGESFTAWIYAAEVPGLSTPAGAKTASIPSSPGVANSGSTATTAVAATSADSNSNSVMSDFQKKVDLEKRKRAAALARMKHGIGIEKPHPHHLPPGVGVRDDEGEEGTVGWRERGAEHVNQHGHLSEGRHLHSGAADGGAADSATKKTDPQRVRLRGAALDRLRDFEEDDERGGPPHPPGMHNGKKDTPFYTQPVTLKPRSFETAGLPGSKAEASHSGSASGAFADGDSGRSSPFDTFLDSGHVVDSQRWDAQRTRQVAGLEKEADRIAPKNEGEEDSAAANKNRPYSHAEAIEHLCAAAFTQDIGALRFLLWETGIPPDTFSSGNPSSSAIYDGTVTKNAVVYARDKRQRGSGGSGGDGGGGGSYGAGTGGDDDGDTESEKSSNNIADTANNVIRNPPSSLRAGDNGGDFPLPPYEHSSANAWGCLALVKGMADAHSKSHVFSALKGRPSWLTPYLSPPSEVEIEVGNDKDNSTSTERVSVYDDTARTVQATHSVLSLDIKEALADSTRNVSAWLAAAGTTARALDQWGDTPLLHAASGGLLALTETILDHLRASIVFPEHIIAEEERAKLTKEVLYFDVNRPNSRGRTALHFALAAGHARLARVLVDAGADLDFEDYNSVSPRSMLSTPGAVSAEQARELFGVTQRSPRKIKRLAHPGNTTNQAKPFPEGWAAGEGGWSGERLAGFVDDMQCDVDQYWAEEITAVDLFNKYFAQQKPVLIRGLISKEDWPGIDRYAAEELARSALGEIKVSVSDIPYANKFGGAARIDMTLREYVKEVQSKAMPGGKHPWYVFKGHPIPKQSEAIDSLVPYRDTPTPDMLHYAFLQQSKHNPQAHHAMPPGATARDPRSRNLFINAQWAVGGAGTGAPVHYHNTAWNMLVYGAKKWYLYSPRNAIMSNRQILDYVESDLVHFGNRGRVKTKDSSSYHSINTPLQNYSVAPMVCVQTAGDVMIVPESWGHGVLNIEDSVAVATESKSSMWRPLGYDVTRFIPSDFDNRDPGKAREPVRNKAAERNEVL